MSGKVFSSLAEDTILEGLGVSNVYTDYTAETISREGITLILRWGDENFNNVVGGGPRNLDVWAHSPKEKGTDYTEINSVLNRVTAILEGIVQEVGDDGISVNQVSKVGASRNILDPGFETITRYYTYRVLLRQVV